MSGAAAATCSSSPPFTPCTACLSPPCFPVGCRALQMCGGADQVVLGPCHPTTLHPDLDWLEEQLRGPSPPRMVVLVNPCNPTGVVQREGGGRGAEVDAWVLY